MTDMLNTGEGENSPINMSTSGVVFRFYPTAQYFRVNSVAFVQTLVVFCEWHYIQYRCFGHEILRVFAANVGLYIDHQYTLRSI